MARAADFRAERVAQKQSAGQDGGKRVGLARAGDVRGAAMAWLVQTEGSLAERRGREHS